MAIDNQAQKVKLTGKTHIRPEKKHGKKHFQLTTFDLPYLAFYYNQKLLLYSNGHQNLPETSEKLKQGLRDVLEEFYQLAGKLGKDEEGIFRVEFDDEDEIDGVEFVEAEADDVSVADLTAAEGSGVMKEMIPYNGVLNLEGLQRPLLAVQLTKLKDGLALGCAFNHAVLDGTATWHFMTSWAELCRGSPSISTPPFLDRTKARATRVPLTLPQTPTPAASAHAPPLREKLFKFTEPAIDKIKSTVNAHPQSNGSKPFSTFQSLSSHIWRHVTKARNLNPEDITVFTVFADCRKRVDPVLPDPYFGNLIQAIFTGTAAGFLVNNSPEFGADVIQRAINGHDALAIQKRNEEWEKSPRIFEFKDAGKNCVAVGSSPRFRVYEVDFGFGKPESVRTGSNNRFDGMMYLYQGKSGGRSIDVEISLEEEAMKRLENDEEFLMQI